MTARAQTAPQLAPRPDAAAAAGVGRLLVSCTDQPGIVAALSRFLRERGANILELDQHTTDPDGGAFFIRMEFRLGVPEDDREAFEREFAREVAEPFNMDWRLWYAAQPKRVACFVSRYDHCLLDLLWRWRRGDLFAEIPLVISNHPDLRSEVGRFDVEYVHVSVEPGRKAAAETEMLRILDGRFDLIVLARYMQILSPEFLNAVGVPVINIHHSFLPAFAGADPYARAQERGVKIIGATAHYVTEELDAGPIIVQDVAPVTHRDSVEALVQIGSDLERLVLVRAVKLHLEDRVIVHENRTVVFQ
jgi:formyltetrahydrofolate deformylase